MNFQQMVKLIGKQKEDKKSNKDADNTVAKESKKSTSSTSHSSSKKKNEKIAMNDEDQHQHQNKKQRLSSSTKKNGSATSNNNHNNNDRTTDSNSAASESAASHGGGGEDNNKQQSQQSNDSESMDVDIASGKSVDDSNTATNNATANTASANNKKESKQSNIKSSKKERKSNSNAPSSRYHNNNVTNNHPFGGTERTTLQQNNTSLTSKPFSQNNAINISSNNVNNNNASFLDGLKEEDRRIRTRLLPAVDGFRKLHKSEIKQDLKLARAIMLGKGNKKDKKEDDQMEVEEDDDEKEKNNNQNLLLDGPFIPPNYNKNDNEITNATTTTNNEDAEEQQQDHGSSENEESKTTSIKQKVKQPQCQQQQIDSTIETISAYNPPRPPESIGPKKKHRLLRWERHPHEIEIDLDNYKKTVDKTRYEWRKLINECQNVECMNGVLRNHFMEHAKNLKLECGALDNEYDNLLDTIRDVASAKGSSSSKDEKKDLGMTDLIQYLQTNIDNNEKSSCKALSNMSLPKNSKVVSGFGGITPLQCSMNQPLGSGWTIPGDKVSTPLGDGIVLDILPICELNPHSNNNPSSLLSTPVTKLQPSNNQLPPFCSNNATLLPSRLGIKLSFGIGYFTPESVQKVINNNAHTTLSNTTDELLKRWNLMHASALNEGVHCDHNDALFKYYQMNRFSSDNEEGSQKCYQHVPHNAHMSPFISTTTNKTIDTNAKTTSSTTNNKSLSSGIKNENNDNDQEKNENNNVVSVSSSQMDIVEGGVGSISEQQNVVDNINASLQEKEQKSMDSDNHNQSLKNSNATSKANRSINRKKRSAVESLSNSSNATTNTNLPLDYNLLPCGSQRGTALVNVHPKDLELCLENQFQSCQGVIANPSNTEIPKNLLKAETTRLKLLSLQAQVLQKRNALCRQRKIRLRNERCFSNSIERTNKVEKLMLEMKDDYVGLKNILENELIDLGIDQKVNCMLRDYYKTEGCSM